MKITVKPKIEDAPKEVGFIHSNGAFLFQSNEKYLVINGFWGSYETSKALYEMWRKSAVDYVYEGDTVEIQF